MKIKKHNKNQKKWRGYKSFNERNIRQNNQKKRSTPNLFFFL